MQLRRLLSSFLATACLAAPRPLARVDALFTTLHREGRFNGVVLVSEGRRVRFQKAYGQADCVTGRPLTPRSVFNLASISKTFTATAVALLVERGQVAFDDTLAKHLPELPYKDITVRQVLQHTSGLPRYELLFDESGAGGRAVTNEDVLASLAAKHPAPAFAAGTRWEYSNTGYALLALMVARVSGQPFPAFLQRHLFTPLGLRHTVVSTPSHRVAFPDEAVGIQKTSLIQGTLARVDELPGPRAVQRIMGDVVGDGGVHATAQDLARWARILDRHPPVKTSTLAEILAPARLQDGQVARANVGSPHPTGYGFGWILRLDAPAVAFHTGGFPGFMTYVARDRDRDRTVVVLDNGHDKATYRAAEAIDELLEGRPLPAWKQPIEEVLGPLLRDQPAALVVARYQELKAAAPEAYRFRSEALNGLGYELLGDGRVEDALALFQLNAEMYPEDGNAFDSLAEAYARHGDRDQAIAHYERALKLDPANDNAAEQLKRLRPAP